MSDKPRMPMDGETPARTTAEVRRGWWPGWIWTIPMAAILIAAWLGLRYLASGGESITIRFNDAHGIKPENTGIMYRGIQIGKVSAVTLLKNGEGVQVSADIDSSATQFLRQGTLFWMKGTNPSLSNLSSLGAVLSGPAIQMDPGGGKRTDHFTGITHKPAIEDAHGTPLHYIADFSGAIGSLKDGDAVRLRGVPVGEISQIGFSFNGKTGALETPVTIALYPSAFHITGVADPDSDAALRGALVRLIHDGLRARLEQSPPLVGAWQVSLVLVPGAPAPVGDQHFDGLPELPVAPGGGLNSILNKFKNVPINQIAQNILDISHHADQLVASPQLADAIQQLDATLKGAHRTMSAAGPQISKLVAQLRQTADVIDQTAKSAHRTIGGVTVQNGLQSTLQEFTAAARSIRELADYLDRHPEALIKGRNGG